MPPPSDQFSLNIQETVLGPAEADVKFRRPFLKWAGNKFQILSAICDSLPDGIRLVEPFAGSGAVFINTEFLGYLICDTNPVLVDTFQAIVADPQKFIDAGLELFKPETNTEERFYELRWEFNATKDKFRKGLLFVYLNRHCFNGLCRFNRKGEFNVPFGRYKVTNFPTDAVLYFASRSKHAKFVCQGFASTMSECIAGDVVYCDPPYVPLSKTASFTSYSLDDFGEAQQRQLADEARKLSARGIPVVISNHDTPLTRELYQGAELRFVDVQRFISCDGANRGKAREVIAIFKAK